MNDNYEQMELDTRTALDIALETVAKDAIQTTLGMIQEHHRQVALEAQTTPSSATAMKPMASLPNNWLKSARPLSPSSVILTAFSVRFRTPALTQLMQQAPL